MTNYPFFKKIIHSFYDKNVYIYSAKMEAHKIGFKYLLLLLCIFWVPMIVKIHLGISEFITTELPPVIEKFPVVEINNGVASFDKPSPYIMKDEKTGKDVAIFDDSGEYTSLENTEADVLVTDTKVIIRKNSFQTQEYSLAQVQNFSLTHEKILSWAAYGKYIAILMYFMIIPCMFLYRAFLALIYTLIGLIFQAILETKFSFQTIYRLSILAFTPAFVIDKLLTYFDLDFPGWNVLCVVISLTYLFFALKANKDNDKNLQAQNFETF
jgi:hypothetical protein